MNNSYLTEEFSDYKKIFKKLKKVIVNNGDYILGREVYNFEKNLAKRMNAKFAITVANGTDAIILTLKALNVGKEDEVITTPYSFIASTSSIISVGAKPVFVDIKDDFNIDENKIETAITKKTKAIVPVNWAGRPCELEKIERIGKKYNLKIIQDSCHAIDSRYHGQSIVNFGDACTFSLHPLKNLNVWGDGGFILTNNLILAKKLYLMRNHGLIDRDHCEFFSMNSRLDTIQAVVANYKIKNKLTHITSTRIKNSKIYDELLSKNSNILTVKRNSNIKEVFHLYHIRVKKKRDELLKYLLSKKIDVKIHYPIPIHLQKASKFLKYKKGDFPNAELLASTSISLPIHHLISKKKIIYICKMIQKFYSNL